MNLLHGRGRVHKPSASADPLLHWTPGAHLMAARVLTTTGWRMPELSGPITTRARPSPKPLSMPPPTDHLITLEGIIKRIFLAVSDEILRYQEALATMDTKFNIQEHFGPRVHAELNLLEYFHTVWVPFVDDGRFIGCSKPMCYCYYHYISLYAGGWVYVLLPMGLVMPIGGL